MFEPLRCRESARLDQLLRAMAADLAGRVIDLGARGETMAEEQ
jgi:hypothetical protein